MHKGKFSARGPPQHDCSLLRENRIEKSRDINNFIERKTQ